MAEEALEDQEEVQKEIPKKGKGKMLIIIFGLFVILGGSGGFFAYKKFLSPALADKGNPVNQAAQNGTREEKSVLFPLDPFIVNLSDQGRFLKMTLQLEITDTSYEETVKQKIPFIRDAVITLLSSKGADSISTPEGKFQLKDELLMRANAAAGKDIFKNVIFTDFVMQ
jgi:flagellar FliL protein